jgi:hypothetical protein
MRVLWYRVYMKLDKKVYFGLSGSMQQHCTGLLPANLKM